MILYLDTSSLVKLYVEEDHTGNVKEWVNTIEIVATCKVAYPESLSAFTRRYNNGDMHEAEYRRLIDQFSNEWMNYAVLDFDELLAGTFVKKYGLRGFDAVHLASATFLSSNNRTFDIYFSSFDNTLNAAARKEGFTILCGDTGL